MNRLRTLLILGRVSNLPTVWSNCLAGWWLGNSRSWDHSPHPLPLLLVAATLLYLGGMFLNDAFDENFDRQYRRERPIPSGAVSAVSVWQMGLALLGSGLILLFFLGKTTGLLGVMLVLCILAYDSTHKVLKISPVLMAGCRFFLYLVAASTAADGVTGWAVWCGLALGAYIIGLSYVAAKESTRAMVRYWPCVFLVVPIVLALVMDTNECFKDALFVSTILGLWIVRHLRYTFGTTDRNIGRTVSGLLAAIALVDLLAVEDAPWPLAALLLGMFGLALLLQRFVPAT